VAGEVVGVPCLGLEGEEDRHPLALGGVVGQQAAVLPDAVVLLELWAVALVHVDVVDAVAGSEAEDLVAGGLGSPPLPEGVQPGGGVGGGALDVVVELVGEVVVWPGCGGRHRPEQLPVEQVGADVVQRLLAGLARQRG
jgi:hypothetical protein